MERVYFLADDPNAARLAAIADLLGAPHERISGLPERPGALVLRGRDFDALQERLAGSPHTVLVYDVESSRDLSADLKPAARSVRKFSISRARPELTTVLSGLEVEINTEAATFERAAGYDTLITADGAPFFVAKDRLLVTGSRAPVDLSQSAARGAEPARDHFAGLLPFAMFIKWALGERCWRAAEACASIVIDDPLLRPRYGCIEFESFLAWLREDNLAATFAFIPWNHRRSDLRTVALFRDNPDRLSICVHGCDHTKGEFSISDPARLDAMAQTALARMAQHESRYGLAHERVMVFPQGKFSMAALGALHRSGYSAAVNTSPFPTDYAGEYTLRDLLDLAITGTNSAPLFRRRYPTDLYAFAADLFFEHPAIIVQHHQDFRKGFSTLQTFIQKLRAIKPDLKWIPLGSLLARSQWQKRTDDGTLATKTLIGESTHAGPWTEMDSPFQDSAKIVFRRYLSEFRDQYIHPSAMLSAAVAAIRR